MATFSISGNAGGSAAANATVQALNKDAEQGFGSTITVGCDVNGGYSFTGLNPGKYLIKASLAGNVYKLAVNTTIKASSLTDVNLFPTLISAG